VVYCNAVLAGASKSTTDKLQQVWNAAAHVVNGMQKYDCRLAYLLHDELHWLDVQYKLCAFFPPMSLSEAQSNHTSDTARQQHLWSAGCHQLFVPRHRRLTFSRLAFSVASPMAWNSLPDYLRDPSHSFDSFTGT